MVRWLIWGVMLMATSGSGTLASRARNTPSYAYHALAAVFSHGTYYVSALIGVDVMVEVIHTHDVGLALRGFIVYAGASTFGSVLSHFIAMHYFEKGSRRVGAPYGERL